jgi:hypothetical protein
VPHTRISHFAGASALLRSAVRKAAASHPPRRIATLRFASTRACETAAKKAPYQALALLSFAALLSGSLSLSAPTKKMESANAVKAEELYNDKSFVRRSLLADLREMYTGELRYVGDKMHLRAAHTIFLSVCMII